LHAYGLQPGGPDGSFFQVFGKGYRNVLARLEGADLELANEYILIGAHYDHVGYGNRTNSYGPLGYIHNGADDNASGVAVLLEVVEAFAKLDQRPRRSILFAFWDGEEKGLLGSKHFVGNSTVPLKDVRFYINMDMVGRLRANKLIVFGSRSAAGSRRMLSHLNREMPMQLDFTWELKDNSDHYPFFEREIPVLMLHTGLHDDYHRPRDDAHKINAGGMQRVARFAFTTVHQFAYVDELPGYRGQARYETPAQQQRFEKPAAPLPSRLGVGWLPDAKHESGLSLTRINRRSAAERAGLRIGDRIVSFGGATIRNGADLLSAVVAAHNPVEVIVARSGAAEPFALDVKLDGRPQRLGISWRTDNAEPGALIISRVVPGSPAARAGIQPNDRIYRLGGEPFAGEAEFLQRVRSQAGRLELLVERSGALEVVYLDNVPPAKTQPPAS
jgi:hypothetical protein